MADDIDRLRQDRDEAWATAARLRAALMEACNLADEFYRCALAGAKPSALSKAQVDALRLRA